MRLRQNNNENIYLSTIKLGYQATRIQKDILLKQLYRSNLLKYILKTNVKIRIL